MKCSKTLPLPTSAARVPAGRDRRKCFLEMAATPGTRYGPHRRAWTSPLPGLLLSVALFLTLAMGCSCTRTDDRPSVLVIIIDTLRADYVGCYGAENDVTPNMDRLASSGVRFYQCVSTVPVTLPSVASILTSSYPIYHGVRDNGTFALDESLVTMAEVFDQAGYSTAGVMGAYVLNEKTGIEQGFEHFDCEFSGDYKLTSSLLESRALEVSETQRRADEVTKHASDWLKGKDNPFFLVVHYFDPHAPYDPPRSFGQRYSSNPYLGEVAYTDAQLGPLLEKATAAAGDGGLITALVADHGEGLGEHGERQHGFFIYDSTLLVPFLVSFPEIVSAGQVVEDQVSTADFAPTVLGLAGLTIPESWQGEDLSGLIAQAERGPVKADPRPCYIETYRTRYSYNWSELVGVRHNGWKLIRAPRPELYNLADDPLEQTNLYTENHERVQIMESVLETALENWTGSLNDRGPTKELDTAEIKKLKALGYVLPSRRPPSGPLPDPKDKLGEVNRRFESRNLEKMGQALLKQGNMTGAEEKFTAALELDPSNAEALHGLGFVLWSRGDHEQAVLLFEGSVKLNPSSAGARRTLGNIYLIQGRNEDAIKELETAVTLAETNTLIRMDYAAALETNEDNQAALQQYQKCLELDPGLTAAHYQAALLLLKLDRKPEAKGMLEDLLAKESSGELADAARTLLNQLR